MDSLLIDINEPRSLEYIEKIRQFLKIHIKNDIADAENFFQSGRVSSIFGIQLISFIEKNFSISISDDDLVMDNFNSIINIAAFVAKKRVGDEKLL